MLKRSFYFIVFLFCTAFVQGQSNKPTAVGRMAGELAVSSTGAATYLVPFVLPPGVKEVVPSLALSYNSQGGDGIAGWGWNLAGLSTISRIGATLHHDGFIDPVDFDAHDRFALDGQRLILTEGTYGAAGSVYTTENYSNIKIISSKEETSGIGRAPKSFIVLYPDGSKAVYGIDESSRNLLEWAISYWEDPQGNRIDYIYKKDVDGLLLINQIGYGSQKKGNHPNSIEFSYEGRNSAKGGIEAKYIGGRGFLRTQKLDAVEIKTQGTLYRRYNLNYKRTSSGFSQVENITEEVTGEIKNPIEFDYIAQRDVPSFITSRRVSGFSEKLGIGKGQLMTGDYNGDGFIDYMVHSTNEPGTYFNIILANQKDNGEVELGFPIEVKREHKRALNTISREFFVTSTSQTELMHVENKNSITVIRETLNEKTPSKDQIASQKSLIEFVTHTVDDSGRVSRYTKKWDGGDVNIYMPSDEGCKEIYNLFTPKDFLSGDFNGDGIQDVLIYQKKYSDDVDCEPHSGGDSRGLMSTEELREPKLYFVNLKRDVADKDFVEPLPILPSLISLYQTKNKIYTFDHNGDGKTDILHFIRNKIIIYSLNSDNTWEVLSEKRYTLSTASSEFIDFKIGGLNLEMPILFGDYNGDGNLDFLQPHAKNSKYWILFTSTGKGFINEVLNFPLAYIEEANKFYTPQDVNGDGKTDLIHHRNGDYGVLLDIYSNTNERENRFTFVEQLSIPIDNNLHLKQGNTIPFPIDFNHRSQQRQYGFIMEDRVYQRSFRNNHSEEVLLRSVSHQGMFQSIQYQSMSGANISAVYEKDESQIYPYININNAPSLYLVKQVIAMVGGQQATQKFKYGGAVSHAGGLGFLGFMTTARSNTFGVNVPALWSVSKHDPQRRGAVTESWTSEFTSLSRPTSYMQRTQYEYDTSLSDKKIFTNLPRSVTTTDELMGFQTVQTYEYDTFNNPKRVYIEKGLKEIAADEITEQLFAYLNNPNATDKTYHIGRITEEKSTTRWQGNSHTTTTKYPVYDNNLVKKMELQGNGTEWLTETMDYDAFGNLKSKTILGNIKNAVQTRTQSYGYSTDGRFLEYSTDIEGLTTRFTYYPEGMLKTDTSPFGHTTTYAYDVWQRPKTVTDYLGNTSLVSYAWDAYNIVKSSTGADGSQSKQVIDPWGRTIYQGQLMLNNKLTLNNKWSWTYAYYDVAGRMTIQSEPYFANSYKNKPTGLEHKLNTRIGYDRYGREYYRSSPTGKTISTTYTRGTSKVSVDDGYQTVSTVMDVRGKVTQMTDLNGTINYTYHPTGELEKSDFDGHIVEVKYDGWGRKIALSDPSAGNYSYKYNIFGEMTQEIVPNGITTYVYDNRGKLQQKTQKGDYTNLVTDYKYNYDVQLEYQITEDKINNYMYRYDYTYDKWKRPIEIIERNNYAGFTQKLQYDKLGRVSNEVRVVEVIGGKSETISIDNAYATNGTLNKILQGGETLWELQEENARGQATSIMLGNGINKKREYDLWGYLDKINDGAALSLSLGYNKQKGVLTHRIRGTRGEDIQENFSYDERSRLISIHKGEKFFKQEYDDRGRVKENGRLGSYQYTGRSYTLDSITLNAHGVNYYTKHPKQEVEYNMDRKAVEVYERSHGRATYVYNDAMMRVHSFYGSAEADIGKRTYGKHYSSIFPAEVTVNQKTGEQRVVNYIGGDGYSAPIAIINTEAHYLHRDHLGSILAITDSAKMLKEERQFGAWGEVDEFKQDGIIKDFSESILPRGFTGHEHFSEVALIHMNGRMYDPQTHRFLAPDNNIQDPYNTMSYDRFGYVWNNPLMNTDPSGEIIETILLIVKIVSYISTVINTAVALANNVDIGQVLFGLGVGILLGQLSADITAGISGLLSSASDFVAGFVGGFAGGFVSGVLGAAISGASLEDALLSGVITGAIAGTLAGLTNKRPGAKVEAAEQGSDMTDTSQSATRPKQTSVLDGVDTDQDLTRFETPKPEAGADLNRLKRKLVNPTGQGVRNDDGGAGHFGAKRGNRRHEGFDFISADGQNIKSPISGKAYGGSYKNKYGIDTPVTVIIPNNSNLGLDKIQLLYTKFNGINGSFIKAGDIIGTSVNLQLLGYPADVSSHIHLKMSLKGTVINPTRYFFD